MSEDENDANEFHLKLHENLKSPVETVVRALGKNANYVLAQSSISTSLLLTSYLKPDRPVADDILANVRAFIDRIGRSVSYASFFFVTLRTLSYLNYLNRTMDGPTLELGVGNAQTSNLIFADKMIDIGSNPNPYLVRQAEKHTRVHKEIRLLDAQNLDLEDESVQTVIANNCMYHVADQEAAYREVYRVLKPGGFFYFDETSFADEDTISSLTATLLRASGAHELLTQLKKYRAGDHGNRIKPHDTIDKLSNFVSSVGFEIVEQRPFLSDDFFSLIYFSEELDILRGLGPMSYKLIQLPSSTPWVTHYKETLAPFLVADREKCLNEFKGKYHFFALRKKA